MVIQETDTGAEIQTQTGWISQEMKFDWDTMFTMSYGKGPFTGMMTSLCTRPAYDTVTCRVEEKEKGWNMTTKLVFSQMGMVNHRILLNENIGKKNNIKTCKGELKM